METFYSSIKTLIGISVLYFICDALISSDKFKSYSRLILGIAVAVALIKPVGTLINSDWNITFNPALSIDDGSYRDDIENIWNGYTSDSLQKYIKNILSNEFGQYTFTVRTYKQENLYRIYITAYDNIPAADITEIENLICGKTGISRDYVNIYLQNPQNKENPQ